MFLTPLGMALEPAIDFSLVYLGFGRCVYFDGNTIRVNRDKGNPDVIIDD
jgi:hypothetical protein